MVKNPFRRGKAGSESGDASNMVATLPNGEVIGDHFEGLPVSHQTRLLLVTREGQEAFRKPYVPHSEEERKLVRKIDFRLMPMLWLMYVLNYIDRTNIGNARIGGMGADLGLTSSQYSLALLIFFIGYLLFEVPSNMILARSRPSIFLPTIMFVWGCMTIAFKGINNLAGLVVLRFMLGIVESGFFPGVIFLLSSIYTPAETAVRFSIFYSASILSGAFGGLLAGGLIGAINRSGADLRGWQGLFVVEGCATVLVSFIAFFVLPDYPSNTKWLTYEERALATKRILVQNAAAGHADRDITHKEAFKMAVSDWRTWILTVAYMCIAGAGTLSYFIPTIAVSLGYSGTQAQLFSAIPYACAFVVSLTGNYSSDKCREKPFHAATAIALGGVFAMIQLANTSPQVKFGILCMVCCGIWTALPVFLSYCTQVLRQPAEKRAVAIAIINSLGNFASVYGSFLWPSSPYRLGWAVTGGFCFLAAALILFVRYHEGSHKQLEDADQARQVEARLREMNEAGGDAASSKEGSAALHRNDSALKHDGIDYKTNNA